MIEQVPLVLTPSVRRWKCHMRGACCKVHRIQVDEREQQRIAKALREAGDPRADMMDKELPKVGTLQHLPMTKQEHCVFLSPTNTCDLRRFGTRVYPSICQQFPFLSMYSSERHVISLTLQCPTALALFAHEGAFEVVVEPEDAEPPTEHLLYLAGEREFAMADGTMADAKTFWRTHWEWFERFRARGETDPYERLTRFAEEVTGIEAPGRAMLRPQQWIQSAFDGALPRQLEQVSGKPVYGLRWLWLHLQAEDLGKLPSPNTDEHGLLLRYLLHRFHLPVAYATRVDLGFQLITMFAMLARYRIERARGHEPMLAIRHLDRLFVHVAAASSLIGPDVTSASWLPYCSLANALTV